MGCESSKGDNDLVEFSNSRCTVYTEQQNLYDEVSQMMDESIAGATMTEGGKVGKALEMKFRTWEANRKHGINEDPNQFDPGKAPKFQAHEAQRVRDCVTQQLVSSVENVSFGIHRASKKGDAAIMGSSALIPGSPGVGDGRVSPAAPNGRHELQTSSNASPQQLAEVGSVAGSLRSRGEERRPAKRIKSSGALAEKNAQKDAEFALLKENHVFVEAVLQLCHTHITGRRYDEKKVNFATAQNGSVCGESVCLGLDDSASNGNRGSGSGRSSLIPQDRVPLWPPTHLTSDQSAATAAELMFGDADDRLAFIYYEPSNCDAHSSISSAPNLLSPLLSPRTQNLETSSGNSRSPQTPQRVGDNDFSQESPDGLTSPLEEKSTAIATSSVMRPPMTPVSPTAKGRESESSLQASTPPTSPQATMDTPQKPGAPGSAYAQHVKWKTKDGGDDDDDDGKFEFEEEYEGRLTLINMAQWQRICKLNAEGFAIGGPPGAGNTLPKGSNNNSTSTNTSNFLASDDPSQRDSNSSSGTNMQMSLITMLNGGEPFTVLPEFEIFAVVRGEGWLHGVTCNREIKKKGTGYFQAYAKLMFSWFNQHLRSAAGNGEFVPAHVLNRLGGIDCVASGGASTNAGSPVSSMNRMTHTSSVVSPTRSHIPDFPVPPPALTRRTPTSSPKPQVSPGRTLLETKRGSGASEAWAGSISGSIASEVTSPTSSPSRHAVFSHFILAFCPPAEILVCIKAAATGKVV